MEDYDEMQSAPLTSDQMYDHRHPLPVQPVASGPPFRAPVITHPHGRHRFRRSVCINRTLDAIEEDTGELKGSLFLPGDSSPLVLTDSLHWLADPQTEPSIIPTQKVEIQPGIFSGTSSADGPSFHPIDYEDAGRIFLDSCSKKRYRDGVPR